jgi:hypothetical protein
VRFTHTLCFRLSCLLCFPRPSLSLIRPRIFFALLLVTLLSPPRSFPTTMDKYFFVFLFLRTRSCNEACQAIYFCCNDCFRDFVLSTLSYANQTQTQVNPANIGSTVRCPVTGDTVAVADDTVFLSFNYGQVRARLSRFADFVSKQIYFCCDDCLSEFSANPDNYIAQSA